MVELIGISKSYGNKSIVKELSLQLKQGEMLALIGASGSGKTTTLKMINRLIEPDEGQIKINGHSIRAEAPALLRRKIGYSIQNVGLFPHFSVFENIAIVPRLLKWPKDKIEERAHTLLGLLQLDPAHFLDRYPSQLSGGQQQRVGIARALAADPPLLLMDEPFASLDPLTRIDIQEAFVKLKKEINQTVIWVTHNVKSALKYADQVAFLENGKLIQVGAPETLLFSPKSDALFNFLKEARAELRFSLIQLKDLLPFLSSSVADIENAALFSAEKDLNHLLDAKLAYESTITIVDEDQKLYHCTFGELMETYYRNIEKIGR